LVEVTPEVLARSWGNVATANSGGPLSAAEQMLIAARVDSTFEEIDVKRSGVIEADEWMHCALLRRYFPGPAAADAIARQVRLAKDPHKLLRNFIQTWAQVDLEGGGVVLREDLGRMGLSGRMYDAVLNVMNVDGAADLSYAEFCAHHLGLQQRRVELYLYDLSKRVVQYISPVLVGHQEEGIWHSGIVVFGREYFYQGIICESEPGKTDFGVPTKTVQLGFTLRTKDELERMLTGLAPKFQPHLYDALRHNCNDLSDAVAEFLLGRHIPNSVRLLAARLRKSVLVKVLTPMMNSSLGGSGSSTGQ